MSVQTPADRNLEAVGDDIESCVRRVFEVMMGSVYGSDDYSKEYKADLRKVFNLLAEAGELLNR